MCACTPLFPNWCHFQFFWKHGLFITGMPRTLIVSCKGECPPPVKVHWSSQETDQDVWCLVGKRKKNPTYRKLIKAMENIGKRDVAESLCTELGVVIWPHTVAKMHSISCTLGILWLSLMILGLSHSHMYIDYLELRPAHNVSHQLKT